MSNPSSSSSEDESGYPPRRWLPDRSLSLVPGTGSLTADDVRRRYKIPDSVEINSHSSLFDPVDGDEVVASVHQLECGLQMPIDKETCEIISDWGITLPQIHPSIFLGIRRLLTIARVYFRHLLTSDIQRIILLRGSSGSNGAGKYFYCRWNHEQGWRLDGFPSSYRNWETPCFRFRNWRNAHQIEIPREPASAALVAAFRRKTSHLPLGNESDMRIGRLFVLPKDLFDVSFPDCIVSMIYERDLNRGRISAPISAAPVAHRSPSPRYGLSSQVQDNVLDNSRKRCPLPSSSSCLPRARKKCRPASMNAPSASIPKAHGGKKFRRL
ncbi:hypothetical protein MKW94_004372 [Papaver nudicaule]|uniref:Uncharacterized protein n=1 Tax=Papaver nudicaule TaxID=74823 RepID=A0AA41V5Y5_PAPNU|nr:hypothetical protein [Papaver nudicaule]